jgi:hypothetical protein
MKFDSNLAWKRATASIGANREVLLALAGVFFVLPSLAFALFYPQPEPAPGQTAEQAAAVLRTYFVSALPALVPMALMQALGTLAMLTLFTDRSRPTVGAAIGQGAAGVLPYVAAQLLLGLGLGFAGGALLTLGAATGVAILVVVAIAAVLFAAAYVWVRTSLAAPVVAVERVRNPFAALQRSWRLTGGNAGRLALFYTLLGLALLIVSGVITMLVGLVLAAFAGAEGARIGEAVVSSMLGAIMALYFVAVLASVHRQLADASAEGARAPLE